VFAESTHGSSIGAVGAESETIVAVRARTFLFMNLCMSALFLVQRTENALLRPVWVTTSSHNQHIDRLHNLLWLTKEIELRGSEGFRLGLFVS
jgi:hypothetical protein